jgi:hypothetical protein
MFEQVTAKFHTMRKPQGFLVQTTTDGRICVQSERSIGIFDPATGEGRLSVKGNTFVHLSAYSIIYVFPDDFRKACADVLNKQRPKTNLGGVVVSNTITVIE